MVYTHLGPRVQVAGDDLRRGVVGGAARGAEEVAVLWLWGFFGKGGGWSVWVLALVWGDGMGVGGAIRHHSS